MLWAVVWRMALVLVPIFGLLELAVHHDHKATKKRRMGTGEIKETVVEEGGKPDNVHLEISYSIPDDKYLERHLAVSDASEVEALALIAAFEKSPDFSAFKYKLTRQYTQRTVITEKS